MSTQQTPNTTNSTQDHEPTTKITTTYTPRHHDPKVILTAPAGSVGAAAAADGGPC